MNIALAQINPIIGDLNYNYSKIEAAYLKAKNLGIDLVITPELSLTGYPPKDLILKQYFVEMVLEYEQKLIALTKNGGPALVFGSLSFQRNPHYLHNIMIFVQDGVVKHTHIKFLLPDYDVFDEVRYFSSGNKIDVVEFQGKKIGLTICEDVWNDVDYWEMRRYKYDPVEELAKKNIDIVVNISASPAYPHKYKDRVNIMSHLSKKYGIYSILVNQVGANSELVFDGRSFVIDKHGELLGMAKAYKEDFKIFDLYEESPADLFEISDDEERYNIALLGIKDYVQKTGFSSVILGLSGGIDSAVVAKLAVDALGKENVSVILLPSQFSSEGSVKDSELLVKNLGINKNVINIEPIYNSMLDQLNPMFKDTSFGLAEENMQARIRGTLLMSVANKFNHLLLTTGNKSEMAIGYSTLYGDMNGALNPIGDIFKTDVYRLVEYINKKDGYDVIPRSIIEKAPSAELRENQKDEDSLPPYDVLDGILSLYLEHNMESVDIIAKQNFEKEIVEEILRKVDLSEYKRRQAPPILKMSKKAFGFGRRFPLVQGWIRNR